ncbi:fimbrial protein [Salmonella enterica]|uniref:fimbrial protein n=1 Tax=Salmonella enterica TaxID=28901 RepID=UPI0009A96687|nr:fimbrial protein [Salmonella enterica]EBK2700673.1 fimbrial-like adhesin [Salmonella enterica subsp. enterica serovar Paratyphi B]EDV4532778.1 fimbrial protein [Salmonella enterica subsp. enterica]EEI9466256.1 fimbrial protein [Salmonella enterica subsp. salamae]EEN5166999.1 fimbrial protein [Salmonella enterica subsp. salamae]EHC8753914.1 fimbrial protein [Salmonella enterica]
MKKSGLIALVCTLLSAAPAQADYALYIGQYANQGVGIPYYTKVNDYTANFNIGIPYITMRSGTGVREVATFNGVALDAQTGLSCNRDHTVKDVNLFHGYLPAGVKSADGKALWKTTVPGMYMGMEFTSMDFGAQYWTGSNPSLPLWLDWANGTGKTFALGPLFANDGRTSGCNSATQWKYYALGGIMIWVKYHLYVDETFDPKGVTSLSMAMQKNQNYDFHFFTTQPSQLGDSAKSLDFVINFNPIPIHYPTCGSSTVTGASVSGSTVNLGEHKMEDIAAGLDPQKFSIKLDNCMYVTDIDVALSSSTVGAANTTLLGNTLTSSAASGVGVLIEGEQNPRSAEAWMTLKPNDSSSIYKFTSSPSTVEGNVQQLMNFRATLKQDGTKEITPGRFKATGRFTINYP